MNYILSGSAALRRRHVTIFFRQAQTSLAGVALLSMGRKGQYPAEKWGEGGHPWNHSICWLPE